MSSTYNQAVEQTITAGEQIHQIVNGTATTEVTVEDGSKVPSIRKALLDNFYFKNPIAWQVGQTEKVFNQLRQFTDGSWWYAPSATASNPISMGSNPVGDPLWKIYDFDAIGKLEPRVDEALRRSYAEAGYNLVDGSFGAGATLDDLRELLLWDVSDGGDGHVYGWNGDFPKSVPPSSTPLSTGGVGSGAWVDRSDVTLRSDLSAPGGAERVYWSHLNGLSVSMTVASRLRKKIYASDLGVSAVSTPLHNRQAMQWMVDQSSSAGVSAVLDVSCEISGHLLLKSNCTILIPRYVSIKVTNGVDSAVITTGSQIGVENVYVEGGVLDGNQQNAPRLEAVSVVSFGVCDKIVLKGVEAKNGSGYGFAFQARPQSTITPWLQGVASNIIFDSCVAANNGVGRAAGGDTYDGFDVKHVDGCLFFKCRATGNSDKGFDPRGDRVFMVDCEAISNGSHGFGFSASSSDTGYPVKGSFFLSNLVSDNNGSSGFFFSEGVAGNTVGYSVIGSGLLSKASGTQGFRVEAQNADIVINSLVIKGTTSHGVYVTPGSVNSLNISQLLVRDCGSNGISIDTPTSGASPIQFSNIDVIGAAYGADIRTPEAVVFTGGRLSGVTNGPIRIDAIAATPVLTGIVDGAITYKKGDVISNINPLLSLKLGLDKVVVSSTTTINNISPMIEGREVTIVASGSLTFQNSSAMQVQVSPVTITDGNLIKLVAINGKWRQL